MSKDGQKARSRGKQSKRHRRTEDEVLADLRAKLAAVQGRVAKRKAKKRSTQKNVPDGPRFSPIWIARHREKLQLSAADYGVLIGVSGLTIYNWEKGKSKPRAKQLAAWSTIRTMRKREAWRILDEMDAANED